MARSRLEIYINALSLISPEGKTKSNITYLNKTEVKKNEKFLGIALNRKDVEKKGSRYVKTRRGEDLVSGWQPYKEFSEKLENFLRGQNKNGKD